MSLTARYKLRRMTWETSCWENGMPNIRENVMQAIFSAKTISHITIHDATANTGVLSTAISRPTHSSDTRLEKPWLHRKTWGSTSPRLCAAKSLMWAATYWPAMADLQCMAVKVKAEPTSWHWAANHDSYWPRMAADSMPRFLARHWASRFEASIKTSVGCRQ